MNIRAIILIFALLTFFTASIGGYLYYHSMKRTALLEVQKDAHIRMEAVADQVNSTLLEYQKIVNVMAGLDDMQHALEQKNRETIARANRQLDRFQEALGVDVCYLIDREGNTIASSNRNALDSFINKNYSFRPYFQKAIAGSPAQYPALGVISKKRGIFYSHPVFDRSGKRPIGVAVIKASVDKIEKLINDRYDGFMLFVDSHGIIFASNSADMLYQSLGELSVDARLSIVASQQFGPGPLAWTGIHLTDEQHAIDRSGNAYMLHRADIASDPGWTVVYLHDLRKASEQASGMMFRHLGVLIALVCIVIGVISIILYQRASIEIIKRRKAEADLSVISERLNTLIHSSPLPITAVNTEGKTILWNPAAERVFGWSADEVIGRPLPIVPRDYQEEHISLRNRILDFDAITGVETRRMKKDGALIDVTVSSATIRDEQGTGVAAMGIYEDITERKKAEEELRFLAEIIQHLPDAVCAVDTAGTTTSWNVGAEKMLGYRADEIVGKPIAMVMPEETAKQEFEHCIALLNRDGSFSGFESMRVSKDGRTIPVEITAVAITNTSGTITHYASIMMDITERKKAESERLKSHMLESIGILAGGIAHDYNNLLSVIMGNVAVARHLVSSDEKACERLSDVENVCEIAASLSKRLITFATGGDPLRKVARMSPLFAEMLPELLKGTRINLELHVPESLYLVAIDEGQIRQVIINLVNNAKEAMKGGGTLIVRGENISVTANDSMPIKEGAYLRIWFRDTGPGIPAENLSKIFDPYFTTKDTYSQKGLGLGLAVCYSIMKRHDGLITVESVPGSGTTFFLYLPARPQDPQGTEIARGLIAP